MNLQQSVLKQFMELYQNPKFKEASKITGIQQTRFFRLVNGCEMKIGEYQILKKLVSEKLGLSNSLQDLAGQCSIKLAQETIKEIEDHLMRKLVLWELKTSNQTNLTSDCIA